ncbi:F0F1 ATP synthase subunit delta [Pseudoruegeria sp. SHC-113]|uniref:F0F1 ATP synthase subunit delta n=1 Tax=Pseudoruegeria sp. SHC-113 TaxID=2855439 RepID=UPI0021BAF852|nr:F0F1 ATP synthase subunit delta [Pseudoruegeria sp. SHC-113]MCT8159614.1 F0F1 ATP synthase subunit delta [Pseudoruegeria sp. SHC-113]
MDVSEPASISSGIASRYATAVFDLAKEAGKIADFESNIADLETALNDSADLRDLISSPLYTRDQQEAGIAAVAKAMKLRPNLANALSLMAQKRRLFVLPQFLAALKALIAEEKGEITADVTAAKKLTKAQEEALAKALKETVGKDVNLNVAVDSALIGGLVVKVGSKMIDTSIRSQLSKLQNSMKEVG